MESELLEKIIETDIKRYLSMLSTVLEQVEQYLLESSLINLYDLVVLYNTFINFVDHQLDLITGILHNIF